MIQHITLLDSFHLIPMMYRVSYKKFLMPLLANISDSRVDREDVKHYNNAFQIAFREKGILEIRAGVTQSFHFFVKLLQFCLL